MKSAKGFASTAGGFSFTAFFAVGDRLRVLLE
jgi:hypothetical protein